VRPSRIVLGLILVGLGVLFLLDQAGTIEAGEVIGDWWPLAVIAVGGVQLVEQPRAPVGPLIVIGVGVILLLTQLDIVADDVWRYVWPVALVIVGLIFLLRRPGARAPAGRPEDVVRTTAIFSGNEVVSTSQRFQGGSATAIFGGVDLDLRQARLDPDGATLAVTAVFGGVDVIVPRGWRVETSGTPIFGGIDTKVDAPAEDGPSLKVDSTVLFGGAELKHDK
jgi:LiaF transmembrane domain/Cell wall-active antibiotics response LiaF, C-terminal